MKYYIKQLKDNDCAFASLKMLLATITKSKSFLYLRQDLNKEEYSLWDVIQIAERNGVSLQGIKIQDLNNKIELEKSPFLALLRNDDDTTHLVFIRKVYKRKILVYDPKRGIYKLTIDEFIKIFTGIYLKVIERRPIFFKEDEQMLVSKTSIVISCVLKVVSSMLLMVGFYFVKEDSHFITPLSFVMAFVIVSILASVFTKKAAHKFDLKLTVALYSKEKNDFIKKYSDSQKYKKLLFVNPSKFITSALIALFFIAINIMNEHKSAVFFTAIVVLVIFDYFIFKFIKDKFNYKMCKLEEELSSNKLSQSIFIDKYTKLSKLTDKFSSFVMCRKFLNLFIIFCLAFTLMAITRNVSLNYLIFTFLTFQITFESISNIISYNSENEEAKALKAKFVSLINNNK